MITHQKINVDLIIVNDELMVPFEAFKQLFDTNQKLKNISKQEDSKDVIETVEPELETKVTVESETQIISEIEAVKDNTDFLNSTKTYNNLSASSLNKLRLLAKSDAIKIANSLLENLFESNKSVFLYKTNTYQGIAFKKTKELICWYTCEPRKSQFLSIYIKLDKISKYLVKSKNEDVYLSLPGFGELLVDRFTKTKMCVVCTDTSKSFYLLIKKLMLLLTESN